MAGDAVTVSNTVEQTPASSARPLRGAVRLALLRRMALGVESERELADAFGVAPSSIHHFKTRPENIRAIEKRRAHIEDALAGLWDTEVANRVAELESDIDRCDERFSGGSAAGAVHPGPQGEKAVLHEIALQLGQLAPRQITGGARCTGPQHEHDAISQPGRAVRAGGDPSPAG